jgi:hypothetical protein
MLMVVLAAALVSASVGPVLGADTFPCTWWKVAFEAPVAFSPPQEIGMDAVALLHPPDSALGKAQMEIALVGVPKEMQESFGNNDTELMNYLKTTFMATGEPAEKKVERTFLGAKVVGDAQSNTIPKETWLELYLVTLSDGDKIAVGFTRDAAMPQEAAESIVDLAARTFKEVPVN